MLPTTYHVSAAILLLAGGPLACFAGYRLFRLVLGIYGFILGALVAVSFFSPATMPAIAIAAVIGGLIGALVLTLAYFLGVALLGVGFGLLIAHTIWAQQGWGEPRALALLGFAIGGAVLALVFQRYVIIAGTAFGGAWTAVVALAAMLGGTTPPPVADLGQGWLAHPFTPPLAGPWVTGTWLLLGIAGLVVQLRARMAT